MGLNRELFEKIKNETEYDEIICSEEYINNGIYCDNRVYI